VRTGFGVERRELGLTGLRLPVIGVGARSTFDVYGKEGQSSRRSLVDAALEESANFFETSPYSGEADGILGSSLTGRRKGTIVAATLMPGDMRRAHAQIDRILRLFEERIDILFAEGPLAWDSFQPVFRQMKSDGSLTASGISCPDVSEFPRVLEILEARQIDVLQIPYNPIVLTAAREILPLAARLNVGVIVVQPFGSGELLAVEEPDYLLSPLRAFGVRSVPQAILKWILSDPRVTSVVPGTRRIDHLLENLAAAEPPWFGFGERRAIVEHFRLHPIEAHGR
jgi:aryl-alcohol dehydrogenase-like predicted oxidoreductase